MSIELAVAFPLFLILLLTSVQAAMWWHARTIAVAAANEGAHTGRTTSGGDADARQAAVSFAERAGGGSVHDVTASTAGSTGEVLRVEVSVSALRVLPIPGLDIRVGQSVQVGRERFTSGDN